MARRKRLELPETPFSGGLETKSGFPPGPPKTRMPIAEVAGDTAGRAALEEVAREMTTAETEGRVVKKIPVASVDTFEFNRDRMVMDQAEMEALKASLAARGQQSPIEVLPAGNGRYGLISGMRRLAALQALGETEALAFVRRPETAQAVYLAMVEENEVRADISLYERANLAVAATGTGIFPTPKRAVAELYANASPAKRSKILKFVILRSSLNNILRFPAAIPEKLGLELARAIELDRSVISRISDALRKTPAEDAAAERRTLERALKAPKAAAAAGREEIAPGVMFEAKKGRAVLSGAGVDAGFADALRAWVVSHAKTFPPEA